jgi:hypothetical protein
MGFPGTIFEDLDLTWWKASHFDLRHTVFRDPAAKVGECGWVNQQLFWTPDNHLRHTKFGALREDKKPMQIVREQ